MSKLAQFLAASQEAIPAAAAAPVATAAAETPNGSKLSNFVGAALRRVSLSRRPSVTSSSNTAATTAAAPSSNTLHLDSLWEEHVAPQQSLFTLAQSALEWKEQGLFDAGEEFEAKTGTTPAALAQDLAAQCMKLQEALNQYQQAMRAELSAWEAKHAEQLRNAVTNMSKQDRPPLPPTTPNQASRHAAAAAAAAPVAEGANQEPERTEPIVMNKFQVPVDLSNESTVDIQDILNRVQQELESRGGFQGEVYTFLKRKDGNLLNKDHSYVGGKVAAQFEFRCDADRKIKTYFISSKCRGTSEPVEDLQSKARDQSKYQLAFDPNDDMVIVGCYKI